MHDRRAPLLPLAGVLLAACAPPAQVRYERRLEATEAPAAHAIHSERLEQLMRGLERLYVERLPKALDLEEERKRRAGEVVEVALAMAESAERIRSVAPTLDLDDAERDAFLRLVGELEERTRALAREAPELPPEALRARVEAIEETCIQCHEQLPIAPHSDAR